MELFGKEAIQEISALARSSMGDAQLAKGATIPYAVIPADAQVISLESYVFNKHAAHPARKIADVKVLDPESFCEYYTLFFDENSRVFAYEPAMQVVGILDYHGAGSESEARWREHKVTLILRESEEWKVWVGSNNKQFTQMQFAEFLEQNSIDITSPQPAHMLEVARELNATTEVEFGAGSRTQDGQVRFKYTETTKASVGAGQLAVPEQFTIDLPVFVGGQRIRMQALLRFRVKDGKLVLWFTLVRPEEVKRTAFLAARDAIAGALEIKIINGSA